MLEVDALAVAYGRVVAVHGVSFRVEPRKVVALVGANGAGKTSTLRAICGLAPPASGRVAFEGRRIEGRPFHRVEGIALSPEGRQLAPSLTVEETLRLGAGPCAARELARRRDAALDRLPALRPLLTRRAGLLSGGQAQLLALGRALMAAPRLLLFDEPSLGLSPIAAREVFRLIPALRDDGLAVLIVEQNVAQALGVADRGLVMRGGRVVAEGPAASVLADPSLVDHVLARAPLEASP